MTARSAEPLRRRLVDMSMARKQVGQVVVGIGFLPLNSGGMATGYFAARALPSSTVKSVNCSPSGLRSRMFR